MAIEKIGVQNFRALNIDVDELQLGNITVLCGVNSVGKSSILKSLLMVKQIDAEGDLEQDIVPLRGSLVDLGNYVTVVQDHVVGNDISVEAVVKARLKSTEIDLATSDHLRYQLVLASKIIDGNYVPYVKTFRISVEDSDGQLVADAEISNDGTKEGRYTAKGQLKKLLKPDPTNLADLLRIVDYRAPSENGNREFWDEFDEVKFDSDGEAMWKEWCSEPKHKQYVDSAKDWCNSTIEISWKNDADGNGLLMPDEIFSTASADFIRFPFEDGLLIGKERTFGGMNRDLIEEFLSIVQAEASLKSIMEKINYIGPIRETPSRYKVYSEAAARAVGTRGENAAYLLARRNGDTVIKPWHIAAGAVFEQITDPDSGEKKDSTLGEEVNSWLKLMTGEEVQCSINKDNYPGLVTTNLSKDNQETGVTVSMSDVGFGVGQVFPIVVEGVMMGADETLFVEQPEVHLHPKMQGDLADFFIAQALAGKQFIIETHSDHIINRLVRRVVEDGLDGDEAGIKNLVKIYFATKTNDGVDLKEVEVDSVDGIINWPEGFFDQNVNEQSIILETSVKKMRIKMNGGDKH